MSDQHISDNGREGKYFHLLVNMADDDLNVYQYRLYGHYKRVCGVSVDSACWESTRTTAEKCKMSVGKVVSTRRELVELGYIELTAGGHEETFAVTLKDLMPENVQRYAKRSQQEQAAGSVHGVNAAVHSMNTSTEEGCSPHEPKKNLNTQEPIEEEKEENARESTPVPAGLSNAIERAAQDVYQPIDNDTAAQMQGDVLMRRYEATCKQLGVPQTLNHRDTRLRRIAAQYYRDTYTPDEVQAAVEAGYADGKLIPFQFLGEKMGALRIPKPALVKGARPIQAASAQKPAPSEPEKQTFDPQTWVRKEIAKGTFDPSVPPVVKVKTHVHA